MFNLRKCIPVLFLSLSFLLCSCTSEQENIHKLKNKSKITLKNLDGNYLCADRNQGNQLFVNRKNFGDWEKFSIHFLKNNKVALQCSDLSFIGSNASNEGQLTAGFDEANNNTIFTLVLADSGRVRLQDHTHKFVTYGPNFTLKAGESDLNKAALLLIEKVPEPQFSYFSSEQLLLLISGLVLLFFSLITFQYQKNIQLSMVLLLFGGFTLRLFVALLNNYLTLWDEQFHALVAKNMMQNPFEPMLYKTPLLPYDIENWTAGHIWLHKQPLFLWQMALSMKIFGVNVFGLRFPSVFMSSIVIYFIYKIGKLSLGKTIGFYGALLFACSNFALEITAGVIHTDHNDVAFLFYLVGSVWAWVEYENALEQKKKFYLILIGLFSGCAILVKWLTGFLVFSGWGLSILLMKERRTEWMRYLHLLFSFGIALLVFLPWQIYILNAFPEVSRHEFSLNSRHFYEVIEGHGGDFWWHFLAAENLYGVGIFLILFSVIVFSFTLQNKIFKIAFLTYLILVYVFFGIAATKMIAFTYSVSFLVYLSFGTVLSKFFDYLILNPVHLPKKIYTVIYTTLILGAIMALNLDIEKIQEQHTLFKKDETSYFAQRVNSIPIIKELSQQLLPINNYVVFNCKPDDSIPIMFFKDLVAAYSQIPDSSVFANIKQKGYNIAVFRNSALPSYLENDPNILKLAGY